MDIKKFLISFLALTMLPISMILICVIFIKLLLKINDSAEIIDLIYVNSITTLLVFLALSSFLLMVFSYLVLFASYMKTRFNITIYKVFAPSTIAFNILLFVLYWHYTKQSEKNLSSFLTHKINEINLDNKFLSLDTMNNIHEYFNCCGYDNAGDYLNATEANSCYGVKVIITTPRPFCHKKNGCERPPLVNRGCFPIIQGIIGSDIWYFLGAFISINVLKLVFIADAVSIYKKELGLENPEIPVEQPLMADNSLKQNEFQVGFKTNKNTPVYERTTQP